MGLHWNRGGPEEVKARSSHWLERRIRAAFIEELDLSKVLKERQRGKASSNPRSLHYSGITQAPLSSLGLEREK